jgi:hypothetical protein
MLWVHVCLGRRAQGRQKLREAGKSIVLGGTRPKENTQHDVLDEQHASRGMVGKAVRSTTRGYSIEDMKCIQSEAWPGGRRVPSGPNYEGLRGEDANNQLRRAGGRVRLCGRLGHHHRPGGG